MKVVESIRLQIEFHKKQQQVIRLRETRVKRITENLEQLQRRMEKTNMQDENTLQDSIYRTFQETESLLQHLRHGTHEDNSTTTEVAGNKMPKDDKVIIEELQTANNHLRGMVETMFSELETYRKENADLKARIADLEAERAAKLTIGAAGGQSVEIHVISQQQQQPQVTQHAQQPVASLLGGAMQESQADLPPLAPLELPHFDFNVNKEQ